MLRQHLYSKVEPLLNRTADFFARRGFTPNQLTLGGLGLSFLAGWAYSGGLIFLGGLILIGASLGDLLDGPLARLTGRATPFGAFLDSTIDRYSDFFLFSGLAYYFAMEESWGRFLVTLGILSGAFVTSYTKARAESLISSCPVGFFERAERIILLALGSLLTPLLPWVLGILLVGTHATALQRIFYIQKTLQGTK